MKYKKIGKGHEDKRMLNDLDRNCTVLELFNHMQAVCYSDKPRLLSCRDIACHYRCWTDGNILKRVLGNFIDEPFLYYDQKKFVLQHNISMTFQTCRI